MSNKAPVKIYTDGGADPNPGPGGWGAVILRDDEIAQELSGGVGETTNNRMELQAALSALESLPESSQVDLYTDSQYLRDGITKWMKNWQRNGWLSSTGESVKNRDLWEAISAAMGQHEITWHWVRGHMGDKYNERAHELASAAIPRREQSINPNARRVYIKIAGPLNGKMGACGWAARIIKGEKSHIIQGRHPEMSINQFSIYAAIEALRALPADEPAQIFTYNSYLHDGITRWAKGWQAKGWPDTIKFVDLWQTLLRLHNERELTWYIIRKDENPPEAADLDKWARIARNEDFA